MSTIHNPVNFEPQDYEILGYIDNQPPKYFWGTPPEVFGAERDAWRKELKELFPEGNAYRCEHCGNGNVRYVVSAVHKPTGRHVCFGDICVSRLNFANADEFKAEKIRSAANLANKRAKLEATAWAFAEANNLKEALEHINDEVHAKNSFARDVASKLFKYGYLSARQVECLLSSLQRDKEYAARKAAEKANAPSPSKEAPEGRVEVKGSILTAKWQESSFYPYRGSLKVLILADEGFKVWCTVPSAMQKPERGQRVRVTATWKQSPNDRYFSFGKRPVMEAIQEGELNLS